MNPLLILATLFTSAQEAPKGPFTLDDALQYADRNAFAILIQRTRVEKQAQNVAETAGRLGPTAGVGATYTRFDAPTNVSFGGNAFTVTPLQVTVGTASINLPIDITGTMHRLVKASKANLYAQRETLAADRSDTRRAVRTAYYAVLRAQSQLTVAQEAVDSDTLRETNIEARFKQGIVARVDMLRTQTKLAQSQADLISVQNSLELAKQSLNNTLARPIEAPVEVVDITGLPSPETNEVKLTAGALKQRHEAKALEQTQVALAEIRRATEQGNLPTLNLGVGYTDTAKPLPFGQRQQVYTGTAALNFPIYDSGVTRARVKQARQDEEQAKLELGQVKLGISFDVRQAVTNLRNANARLAVATKQVETAREALREAQVKQQQGVGILLEVLDAQADLTTAESGQVAAKYDYLQAIADLQRAYGSDQLPDPAPKG